MGLWVTTRVFDRLLKVGEIGIENVGSGSETVIEFLASPRFATQLQHPRPFAAQSTFDFGSFVF